MGAGVCVPVGRRDAVGVSTGRVGTGVFGVGAGDVREATTSCPAWAGRHPTKKRTSTQQTRGQVCPEGIAGKFLFMVIILAGAADFNLSGSIMATK